MSISNSAKLFPWSSPPWPPPSHSGSGLLPATLFSPLLSSFSSPAARLPLWSVLALLTLLSSTQPHFPNHCQAPHAHPHCPTLRPPHPPGAHFLRGSGSHNPHSTPYHIIIPPGPLSQGPPPQTGLHGQGQPHRDGAGCPPQPHSPAQHQAAGDQEADEHHGDVEKRRVLIERDEEHGGHGAKPHRPTAGERTRPHRPPHHQPAGRMRGSRVKPLPSACP